MKAVFFESDWPEELGEQVLVTRVKPDEQETDAILRAMELYGADKKYYVREHFGVGS